MVDRKFCEHCECYVEGDHCVCEESAKVGVIEAALAFEKLADSNVVSQDQWKAITSRLCDSVRRLKKSQRYKTWEIWSEGYNDMGSLGKATLMGRMEAETFQEACCLFFESHLSKAYFNPDRLTFWACQLYDNENDARKAFG